MPSTEAPNTTVAAALASLGFPPGSYLDEYGAGAFETYHDPATTRVLTDRPRDGEAATGRLFVACGGMALFSFPRFDSGSHTDGYGRPRPRFRICSGVALVVGRNERNDSVLRLVVTG